MEIVLAFLFGLGIYFFFRFVERYFSRHYFYFSDLVLGGFSKTNLILSIVIPLFSGFAFGFLIKTPSLVVYALPGFIGALLTVWPNIARPELLPHISNKNKFSLYISYYLFIISFTAFSYIGGLLGKYITAVEGLAPSRQGLIDGLWVSSIIGVITLLSKWAKK